MVTERLERYVRARFPASEFDDIIRAQAAVLLVADGRGEDLAVGFDIAEQDWRDLLMAAGLEHLNWGDVFDSHIDAAEG